MMANYRTWCRLCGGLSGSSKIEPDSQHALELLNFNISLETLVLCQDCNIFLYQINSFIEQAKIMAKMFNGLDEESESDLTVKRLNAYRAHFNLNFMISEDDKEQKSTIQKLEPIDSYAFKVEECDPDYEEENLIVEHIDDSVITDASTSFEIENNQVEPLEHDAIIESDEEVDEDSEMSSPNDNDKPRKSEKRSKNSILEKTEAEKLFKFKCHICDEPEYTKMFLLKAHCQKLHNCLPSVQCTCGKMLSTWRRLLIHKEKHFPRENCQTKCSDCGLVFANLKNLDNHIEKAHKNTYVCSYCAKIFREPKTLRWHEMTHEKPIEERRNWSCEYCAQKFITKQAMENHIGMKHYRVIAFFCDQCNKGFFTKKSMLEHQRCHKEPSHACNVCDFKSKTKSGLNVHLSTHRTGSSEEATCDICGMRFSHRRRLKAHLLCHSDIRKHQCPYCESSFKRSKDLKAHLNIHTGLRPHICHFCTRNFTNGSNRRKHELKDHSEEVRARDEGRNMEIYSKTF